LLHSFGCSVIEIQSRVEELEDACRTALWIRDRLQERGRFGGDFEEWQDIERALTPNSGNSRNPTANR
jgi:hypothetical protein